MRIFKEAHGFQVFEVSAPSCSAPVLVSHRGTMLAPCQSVGVKRVEDLIAWQLANALKLEVYRLIRQSRGASADLKFRDQVRDSASSVEMNIGEGFYRYGASEMARFLSIALSSLGETSLWLRDGIDREYFDKASCAEGLALAKRCRVATLRLHQSLQPFIKTRHNRRPLGDRRSDNRHNRVDREPNVQGTEVG